jgi:hypothetical protein
MDISPSPIFLPDPPLFPSIRPANLFFRQIFRHLIILLAVARSDVSSPLNSEKLFTVSLPSWDTFADAAIHHPGGANVACATIAFIPLPEKRTIFNTDDLAHSGLSPNFPRQ